MRRRQRRRDSSFCSITSRSTPVSFQQGFCCGRARNLLGLKGVYRASWRSAYRCPIFFFHGGESAPEEARRQCGYQPNRPADRFFPPTRRSTPFCSLAVRRRPASTARSKSLSTLPSSAASEPNSMTNSMLGWVPRAVRIACFIFKSRANIFIILKTAIQMELFSTLYTNTTDTCPSVRERGAVLTTISISRPRRVRHSSIFDSEMPRN